MTTQNTKNIKLETLDNIVLPRLKACRNRNELNNFLTSAIDEGLIRENPYFLIQLWELQVGILKEGQRVPFSRRPADVVPSMEKVMETVRENALDWKKTTYQRNSKHPVKVAALLKLENTTETEQRRGATGMMLVMEATSTNIAHYVVGKNVATGEKVWIKVKWKGEDGDWVADDVLGIDNGTDYHYERDEWKATLMAA